MRAALRLSLRVRRLLDPSAGHWRIAPAGEHEVERAYEEGSPALRTTFTTDGGEAELLDALATGPDERGHELARHAPAVLLRRIRCTAGSVRIVTEFSPRPEYGFVEPLLEAFDGGVRSRGGPLALVLSCSRSLDVDGPDAGSTFELEEGDAVHLALHFPPTGEAEPDVWDAEDVDHRLEETLTAWRSWSEIHQGYQGPWAEAVHHSGRVLHGLTYRPTGAVIAAPSGRDLRRVVGRTGGPMSSRPVQARRTSSCLAR